MVLAYIRNLPPESSTVAAIRGGEQFRGWGPQLYMLTNLLDAIRENTYVQVASNAKRKPKAPEPFARPDAKSKKKPSVFATMARAAWNTGRSLTNGGT